MKETLISYSILILFLRRIITNQSEVDRKGESLEKNYEHPAGQGSRCGLQIWNLGRIFGFGDIEIESAGTYGKIIFSFIPSPLKLQGEIEKAILNFFKIRPFGGN
jgi:hypothetical protein